MVLLPTSRIDERPLSADGVGQFVRRGWVVGGMSASGRRVRVRLPPNPVILSHISNGLPHRGYARAKRIAWHCQGSDRISDRSFRLLSSLHRSSEGPLGASLADWDVRPGRVRSGPSASKQPFSFADETQFVPGCSGGRRPRSRPRPRCRGRKGRLVRSWPRCR